MRGAGGFGMTSNQRHSGTAESGTGGLSLCALDPLLRSPHRALRNLIEWQAGHCSAAAFPYHPIVRYFQAVGRSSADIVLLRTLHTLSEEISSGSRSISSPILSGWLPSTFDQEHETMTRMPLLPS
jgi:hypothetical protein